jgi:uncharacterized protein (DUF1800 family)
MLPDQSVDTPVNLSMAPYAGPWTKWEAAHLLKRTMFGPTNQQMLDAVAAGMNATVASVLQIPVIDQPLAFDPGETIVPYGTTWVNALYPTIAGQAQTVESARQLSLGAWIMKRLNTEPLSIAEKLCFFWVNHFGVTAIQDSRGTYNYHMLLRQHALGNFKQMIKDVTVDPAMLLFLNGATNTLYSPNENYARELLELFTIGKGPQIGPGDYTHYTEEDVAAGAKILTGYIVEGLRSSTLTSPQATFYPILHDTTTKQLSYHFGNATVTNNGANEYSDYIDIIFQQDQVATHICTKLYRYFVNYDLTTDVETNIIPVMSQTMINNNYEILPVLDELFKSEHFYDVSLKGAVIRNPLEAIFGAFNPAESVPNFNLTTNSNLYLLIYGFAQGQGLDYATPPSVAGWTAYYLAPNFTKLWLSSSYIKNRFDFATLVTIFTGIPSGGNNFKVNALTLVDGLSIPSDAQVVIDDLCEVYCPKPISAAQKLVLKNILTNGLPDFEWTIQYNDYLANPGNTTFSDPVRLRVELVINRILKMPEFHTI